MPHAAGVVDVGAQVRRPGEHPVAHQAGLRVTASHICRVPAWYPDSDGECTAEAGKAR